MLEVKGISKTFPGTKALSEVQIDVKAGEVHALVGENGAGKSTLMNIISGVFQPDEGKIYFLNKPVRFNNPKEAQDEGIGFVHQELALCQHISVSENIFMGNLPVNSLGIVDRKRLRQDTENILKIFKSNIKPDVLLQELNIAEQQIIEIAKALSHNCKLLILDEPTSSLSDNETRTLFEIIKTLKEKQIGVLYISHRMAEILEICDRVTILRDGKYIKTVNVKDTTAQNIVASMVGRELHNLYPSKSSEIGGNLLCIKNLTKKGQLDNINFSLRKGEILGFSGLVGAGRTEVVRAICGIDPKDTGSIYLEDKEVIFKNYNDSIKSGICYLTEDRKQQGLFLNLSVKDNLNVAVYDRITNRTIISSLKEKEVAEKFSKKLNIKIFDLKQKIESLSGGNQQKVMIAKWLSIDPKVIFLDEPTRGIDVGAKAEIHNMLRELANEGIGIVIISSELPEIIGMCDRVLVMREGKITGEVSGEDINEKNLIMLASGQ